LQPAFLAQHKEPETWLLKNSPDGTRLGQNATDLVGFYGATPVDQPATVADATDAATAITTVNAVIDRLQELGLIA
jgi:hypothetical protein